MLPIAIPKEKFEKKVLNGLSDKDIKTIKDQYTLISVNDDISDEKRAEYAKKYANFEKNDIYILNTYIPQYEIKPLYEALFQNYTTDDFNADNKAAGINIKSENASVNFDLTLNYTLTQDGLNVELDCSKLKKSSSADINSINILEFFGSASNTDEGYIMIPDGCGGIINFNGNNGTSHYSGKIYGEDNSIRNSNLKIDTPQIQLPVFGLKRNNSGVFAIAGSGAEYCSINADAATDIYPYNRAYISAEVYPYDEMEVANPISGGGKVDVYVHQKEIYNDSIGIDYYILEKNKNTYSDMANFYRNKLVSNGVLKDKLEGDVPFVLSFLGAVDVKKHFLGIPYTGYQVFTDFNQAEAIIDEIRSSGIDNIHLKYKAWFNGGIKQTSISRIDVLGCLGGRKGLKRLIDSEKAIIFPEISVADVYDKMFDGFSPRKNAVKTTYTETLIKYPINYAKNYFDYNKTPSYLMSPKFYNKEITAFNKRFFGNAVAVLDIATNLNSDFSKKNFVDRTKSIEYSRNAIEKLSQKYTLMLNAPNLYSMKFSNIFTEMPMTTSGANIFNYEIPFLQMVLSGYKDMSTSAINISYGNYSMANLLSFGMLPNYTLSYAESSEIKNTEYSEFYSLHYKDWLPSAVKIYEAYQKDLKANRGSSIIGHKYLANGLVEIQYENNNVLIINTSDRELIYENQRVPSGKYIKRG